MFDLITGATKHSPHHQLVPIVVSVVAHVTVAGAIVISGMLFAGVELPAVRSMMAFAVAAPPPAPPPPPPPLVQAAAQQTPPEAPKPVLVSRHAAPVETLAEIVPEPFVLDFGTADVSGEEGGVPGGIPGGIVGGVSVAEISGPPPPEPPRAPIRVGGKLQAPTLVHQVSPVYPSVATAAGVEGTVILEAIVDEEGRVEDLKVLRSSGVLDRAALEAVRQWRYEPLLLNGQAAKFILTVVVSFSLSAAR